MPVLRGIMVAVVGAALAIVVAASQPASANEPLAISGSQPPTIVSTTPALQQSSAVVWGKVPYCSCLINSAGANVDNSTANVAGALKKANLTVSLKDQSPREGWMYFTVTFDPNAATREQVRAAIVAGGGQVLEGPP